jgi:hypothetical protein
MDGKLEEAVNGGHERSVDENSGHSGHAQETPLMDRPLPGFWSPYLAAERKIWTKMFVAFIVLLVAIIMGILSLYWGADHSLQFNMPVLTVALIDFDNGEVGPFLQQMGAAARAANPKRTLGYVSQPGSKYNYSNDEVRRALQHEDFWFAVVAQANATTAMNHAYDVGNSSYDPTGAVHVYYEEGRNALTIDEIGYPVLLDFLTDFVMSFTKQKQQSLAASNAGNAAALARQADNPIPVAYTLFNTAPDTPSTAEAATEIGTICKMAPLGCSAPPCRLLADRSRSQI